MRGASFYSRKHGSSFTRRRVPFGLLLGLALVACDGKNSEAGDAGPSGGDGDSNMDGGRGGDGDAPGPVGDGGPNGGDGGQTPDPDAGPMCSPACADTNNCTADECVAANTCIHELDARLCPQGQSCHPMKGCGAGAACSNPGDCADEDGCTTNERCDGVSATCQFDPLDGDDDGFAPAVCGGGDCNDQAANVNPGQTELCNNRDDDCDGTIDDNAVCSGGRICVSGDCVCPEGQMQCGGMGGGGGPTTCADLNTNADHCGACGNDCGPAGVCSAGQCTCPAPAAMCGNSCVDTKTSFQHCGGCNMACELQPQVEACVAGACVACGTQGAACCGALGEFQGCFGGLSCSGTPNTAGAMCQCASPSTMCGEDCVNTATSEAHCGQCDNACGQGQQCQASAGGTPTCTDCGGAGERCCQVGTFGACFGGGLTCDQQTQMCVAGGGGPGPGPGN